MFHMFPIWFFITPGARFVHGCMCLKGMAKTMDLAILLREQRKAAREQASGVLLEGKWMVCRNQGTMGALGVCRSLEGLAALRLRTLWGQCRTP